jgi:hypothetical protein
MVVVMGQHSGAAREQVGKGSLQAALRVNGEPARGRAESCGG